MKFNSIVVILALLLAACSGLGPDTSNSGSDRLLTVTANGQVPVEPDIAYLTVGVHSSNEDVAKAVDENNRQIEKVTQTLKEQFGIAETDIQTANFNLWAQDQFNPEGEKTGVIYSVDNTVYVTIRKLDTLGEILDEVVKIGANSIWGIQFDIADKSSAIDEARAIAVENAKHQAEALAQAAGVTLGEIQAINFYGGYPSQFFGGMGGGGGGGGDSQSSVSISAGQLMVSVDVNISYTIEK